MYVVPTSVIRQQLRKVRAQAIAARRRKEDVIKWLINDAKVEALEELLRAETFVPAQEVGKCL